MIRVGFEPSNALVPERIWRVTWTHHESYDTSSFITQRPEASALDLLGH